MSHNGFILLDKPSGINSRGAGGRIARMFGTKTFGHIGTLDPMASGLIVIAIGEATKMIPYMECVSHPKEYEFSVVWGIETDTGDITGKVMNQNEMFPTEQQLATACAELTGEYDQVPPIYSAVHINGVRAYQLARAGQIIDIPPRRVKIYELENYKNPTSFRVKCSAGTYVRSLAKDIAAKCGTVATCDSIHRSQTNGFHIKDAVSLDFIQNLFNNGERIAIEPYLRAPDFGLGDIPVQVLDENNARLFKNGGFIDVTGTSGLHRIYTDDKFVGMGVVESNVLKPKRIILN